MVHRSGKRHCYTIGALNLSSSRTVSTRPAQLHWLCTTTRGKGGLAGVVRLEHLNRRHAHHVRLVSPTAYFHYASIGGIWTWVMTSWQWRARSHHPVFTHDHTYAVHQLLLDLNLKRGWGEDELLLKVGGGDWMHQSYNSGNAPFSSQWTKSENN